MRIFYLTFTGEYSRRQKIEMTLQIVNFDFCLTSRRAWVINDLLAQSEVNDEYILLISLQVVYMKVSGQNKVIWLNIAMNKAQFMQFLKCAHLQIIR